LRSDPRVEATPGLQLANAFGVKSPGRDIFIRVSFTGFK
jgi:hypothetical protein